MMKINSRPKIASLEIGRGIAALLVCLFHFPGYSKKYFDDYTGLEWFSGGNAGVEYFFVLSGFIILWIHRSDIGKPARAIGFVKKRFIRLYPIYWVIVIPVGLMIIFVTGLGDEKELTFFRFLMDTLLIPRPGDLTIPPTWTLHRELLFYLLFTFFIVRPSSGVFLIILWQVICVFSPLLGIFEFSDSYWFQVIFGSKNLGFGLGLSAAWLMMSYTPGKHISVLLTVLGSTFFLGLVVGQGYMEVNYGQEGFRSYEFGPWWGRGFLLSSFLLILGCVGFEKLRPLRIPSWLSYFGGSSYVLYLIHEPAGSVIYKVMTTSVLKPHIDGHSGFFIAVVFVTVLAMLVHIYIEKPMLKLGRNLLFPRAR